MVATDTPSKPEKLVNRWQDKVQYYSHLGLTGIFAAAACADAGLSLWFPIGLTLAARLWSKQDAFIDDQHDPENPLHHTRSAELHDRIVTYADRLGTKKAPRFYHINDDNQRYMVAASDKGILLNEAKYNRYNLNDAQTDTVLAHEVAHFANKDYTKATTVTAVGLAAVSAAFGNFVDALAQNPSDLWLSLDLTIGAMVACVTPALTQEKITLKNALPLRCAPMITAFTVAAGTAIGGSAAVSEAALSFALVLTGTSLLKNNYERRREYRADEIAAHLTEQPEQLVYALTTMEVCDGEQPRINKNWKQRLGNDFVEAFESHPYLEHRVANLDAVGEELDARKAHRTQSSTPAP